MKMERLMKATMTSFEEEKKEKIDNGQWLGKNECKESCFASN